MPSITFLPYTCGSLVLPGPQAAVLQYKARPGCLEKQGCCLEASLRELVLTFGFLCYSSCQQCLSYYRLWTPIT